VKYGGLRSRDRGLALVYDITVTIMGMIHGLIGVSWMGMHVSNSVLLIPQMKKAQKLADAPILRSMEKISKVAAILGFLTLITGLIFFIVKWQFDFGKLVSEPEPRAVFIALILVLMTLVLGMGFLRPRGQKLGKAAAGLKPMDDLPEDFKADLKKLALLLEISGAFVTLAFIMMIVAINGGI
jgi:vacuolar-type H+-ATPase subunit I/STV1